MSVADQINRIKTNIANTYTAAQAKGATMPQTQNSDNLAACVQSITTGGGGGTQFGLTAEQMLGTPDSEGNLIYPTLPSITFTGLKNVSVYAFFYKFYKRNFEDGASVSFPDLTTISSGGMQYCFSNCKSLASVDLPALTSVGANGLEGFLAVCTSLTTISFPSLTSVGTDAFGSFSFTYCFNGCTALTEIHFRADAQATIEAITGYADKFGAKNATIYFDL